jgi:protein-disulfide isomerase
MTALLAVAVAASETALDHRERLRAGRAQLLQEILDDPKELERYFAAKAARQYDQAAVVTLETNGVPFRGPAQAPIRVVEYSDFLCPYCRELANAMGRYLPRTEGRVSVFYKNYPFDQQCNPNVKRTLHPGSCWVSLGAICATDQGRFWSFHDRAFSSPPAAPQAADVVRMATEVGIDPAAFQTCLSAPATRDRLEAQIKEAYEAGVRATPTLFINGKRLPRINDFATTVSKEAAREGLPPLPAE